MTTKIIPKHEAIEQGLKHYHTGKLCKHGHDSVRLVSTGKCCQCAKIYHDKYIKHWQAKNKKRVNEATSKWRRTHPNRAKQVYKKYYDENRDQKLSYNHKWRGDHCDLLASYNANRRATKLKATPKWIDINAVQQLYIESNNLYRSTGIPHHVDHIVPLIHTLVCGLHCEHNLQIITAEENLAKGNTFEVS